MKEISKKNSINMMNILKRMIILMMLILSVTGCGKKFTDDEIIDTVLSTQRVSADVPYLSTRGVLYAFNTGIHWVVVKANEYDNIDFNAAMSSARNICNGNLFDLKTGELNLDYLTAGNKSFVEYYFKSPELLKMAWRPAAFNYSVGTDEELGDVVICTNITGIVKWSILIPYEILKDESSSSYREVKNQHQSVDGKTNSMFEDEPYMIMTHMDHAVIIRGDINSKFHERLSPEEIDFTQIMMIGLAINTCENMEIAFNKITNE